MRNTLRIVATLGLLCVAAPTAASELVLEPSYRVHQSESLGSDKSLDIDLRFASTLGLLPKQLEFEVRAGYRSFSYFGELEGIPLTVGARFYLLELGVFRPSLYAAGGGFFGILKQFDNIGSIIGPMVSAGVAFDFVVSQDIILGLFVGWEKYFRGLEGLDGADWLMIGARVGHKF